MEDRNLRDFLYKNVMSGNWGKVVEKYSEEGPRAQGIVLTPTKDTALHMAAFDNQEPIVAKLVTQICAHQNKISLAMKNEKGNTPLHIAAALGSARMCHIIASVDPDLVDLRNKNRETPLFLAALGGHKHSFYCLSHFCCFDTYRFIPNSRRLIDGDTILHCAIKNEQFDLAFHLINMFPAFTFWKDGQHFTALHVLASMPTVFKSGCHLHGFRKMLYYCTPVEKLKPKLFETLFDESWSTLKPNAADSSFPKQYTTCIQFFKTLWNGFLSGSTEIMKKIREEKQKHTWSVQVMEKLLEISLLDPNPYYWDIATAPPVEDETRPSNFEEDVVPQGQGSPMVIAAKNGVIEMVIKMFEHLPVTIHDTSAKKKNVLHLAAEYRQPEVFKFLVDKKYLMENVFQAVDDDGNSALHLAAQVPSTPRLWGITGTALQMQWEVKWYQFVKESVPREFYTRKNEAAKTPNMIFHETHKELVDEGKKWLISTSQSCSVVAALIATVAFASAATIPGGNGDNGFAVLEKKQVFFIYSISSLIALCLSSTSVIMFLAILTSRFEPKDFASNLPWKLFIGLSSLYFSIIAMIVSFCAGHFFLLTHRIQNFAVLLYVLIFLPVNIIFAVSQLPLFFDLLQALRTKVPKMSADVVQFD